VSYTKEDILRKIKEDDIRFIRLQFVDIFGIQKNVAIMSSQAERALNNSCMFDGSSIEGFVRVEESDMYLWPDLNSYVRFPWCTGGNVARFICDIYKSDRTPFEGDPRYVLKKVVKEAESMGYTFNVGPELEFFLFHRDENGSPTTKTHDDAGYFDLGPVDLGENARRDICLTLEDMGFEIEGSHHEVARGQHEIDFKYADAITAADNIMTFKLVVKTIAQKYGLHATFMPKPIYGIAGSGMHTNMSLLKNGKNAFADENDKLGLSKDAYHFIAGILKHIKGFTAIANPIINSYKRLVPGYEAPCYITWSAQNRSTLIRIPSSRGEGTRIELRSPDPSANPYLLFAVLLAAGLDGIKKELMPNESNNGCIYDLSDDELENMGIDKLPETLDRAVECMIEDPLIRQTLGDHIFNKYVEAKKAEIYEYRTRVSSWEIDRYLSKY